MLTPRMAVNIALNTLKLTPDEDGSIYVSPIMVHSTVSFDALRTLAQSVDRWRPSNNPDAPGSGCITPMKPEPVNTFKHGSLAGIIEGAD